MPREHESTHPFIDFTLRGDRLGLEAWLDLGEIRARVEQLSVSLLKPSVSAALHEVYMTKGARATTAIEGNTLTEDEVRRVISGDLTLPASREYLAREVENVVSAVNEIADALMAGAGHLLSVERMERLNARVLRGLDVEEGVAPGRIREHSVLVGGVYRGAPAGECAHLLARLCDWLNGDDFDRAGERAVPMAVLKAVLAHLHVAWIHPFGDGNGRTARLVELEILLAAGVPTPASHLPSNHYNQTRTEYARLLALSSRQSDPLPFVRYAIRGLRDGLREQLARVWSRQLDDRWEQLVYERFAGRGGQSDVRRRRLVLALSRDGRAEVPAGELRRLTPELAEAYAGRTTKTLTRDVNVLIEFGLVARSAGRVKVLRDQLLGLLPTRRPPDVEGQQGPGRRGGGLE